MCSVLVATSVAARGLDVRDLVRGPLAAGPGADCVKLILLFLHDSAGANRAQFTPLC